MTSKGRRHFLMLVVPAGYGHFIPAVSLARKISENHDVTLVVCKAYLEHARKKEELTVDDKKVINIIGLEDGLPSNPSEDLLNYINFTEVDQYLHPAVRRLLRQIPHANGSEPILNTAEPNVSYNITKPVDVIIGDVFAAESLVVCAERQMPYYIFSPGALIAMGAFFEIDEDTPTTGAATNPMETFFCRTVNSDGLQRPVPAMIKTMALSINKDFKPAKGFIVNSFWEFDKEAISVLKTEDRFKHMDFYCIGPLIPQDKIDQKNDLSVLQKKISDWLDGKPKKSVVYVSFGSVAMPGKDRVVEAGKALLALGKSFIFSLKHPLHSFLPAELQERIPSQFGDPKSGGLIVPWAPQKMILRHPAVQVFVSHCGWNSTIESLFAGIPVVGWPCFGDQLGNSLWLEKIGVAVSLVPAEAADPHFKREKVTAENVAEAVRVVDGSQSIQEAAHSWGVKLKAAVGPGGRSTLDFQTFLSSA